MKPKDNKELRELERYLNKKENFQGLDIEAYTVELYFYGQDGEPRGCFTKPKGRFLEKALAQARQASFSAGFAEGEAKGKSAGREEAIKKINGLWAASRSELMQGNNKREIEVLDIFYGRIKDRLKEGKEKDNEH
jgi:hypothetical protein